MKVLMTPDALRQAVRTRVCDPCPHCTPGFEGATADVARPCEGNCVLFRSLPSLKRAAECADPMLRSPESASLELMNRVCRAERERLGRISSHPAARAMKRRGNKMAKLAAAGCR